MSPGDRGTGLIGSIAALTAFLALLLFATQLLLTLHARTVVASAAHEGARSAAIDPANPSARTNAEQRARDLMGAMGSDASFDWSGSTTDAMVLRIRVEAPRFVVRVAGGVSGGTNIDRRATVQVERLR
jgi:hypothetical protein